MEQRDALLAFRNARHGQHSLAPAEPQLRNCKLCGHPGGEAHRVAKAVCRSVVDLESSTTRGGAELRRMHADEDPPASLSVAVNDGLLAVPTVEELLEGRHDRNSITSRDDRQGLR